MVPGPGPTLLDLDRGHGRPDSRCGAGSFWPVLNGGTSAILFCFHWLYYAAAGAGPWSLDAKLQTPATLTEWIGGSESNRQLHVSPPSRPIQT